MVAKSVLPTIAQSMFVNDFLIKSRHVLFDQARAKTPFVPSNYLDAIDWCGLFKPNVRALMWRLSPIKNGLMKNFMFLEETLQELSIRYFSKRLPPGVRNKPRNL
jgi:hypothetical protein